MTIDDKFTFCETTIQQFQILMESLNPKKATVGNDLSGTLIYADVIPIHKKDEKTNTEN